MTDAASIQIRLEAHLEDVILVIVEGSVDIYSSPQLKEALLAGVTTGRSRVLIDVTRAAFLDASGLAVLASYGKRAGRGTLAIVCSDPAARRVCAAIGLDQVLTMYISRIEALRTLANQGRPRPLGTHTNRGTKPR